ncbi:LEA type 2 family protein [Salinilacihabitans rarus]|uniref:LEA type 2 family protein n=1 Tax=Salinilacihabitans rarus TaxID=2961596 RepID=UPI0020C907B2|nr:LEA type 2 family protein [Salinilacihabitans rarus]
MTDDRRGSSGALRIAGVLLLATLVVTLVALAVAYAAGVVGVPSIEAVDAEFGDVNETHTEVHTAVAVENPNPVGADVSVRYAVAMNDVEVAAGEDDVALPAGRSTEHVTVPLRNDRIPEWWATHVENGEETEVTIDATIESDALGLSTSHTEARTVETDVLATLESTETRPVNADQPGIDDPVLYVNRTEAEWGDVDAEGTELELRADVYNPQPFDVPVTELGYEADLNGVVVGEGTTGDEYRLRAGEVTTVEATTRIENERLDEWWVTHVENDEVSTLRVSFEARVPLGGVTITVPLDALAQEGTVETDVFGEGVGNDSTFDPRLRTTVHATERTVS